MNNNSPVLSDGLINMDQRDLTFASVVNQRSGVNVNSCWHCLSCVGGCHFYRAMDYAPNAVIRFVQLGLKREALENSAIWLCVGCNSCSIQCPNSIDVPAINDTLCEIAMEEGVRVAEPNILSFHKEFLHSVKRYGRAHKLEIMLRYKAKNNSWFDDLGVGLRMLLKRKLHLLPSRSSDMGKAIKHFEQSQVA